MIGNCYGADTEIFYDKTRWQEAEKFCRGCPVLMECRKEFSGDSWAFAGGMSPELRANWHLVQMRGAVDRRKGRSGRNRITPPEKIKEVLEIFDREPIGAGAIARQVDLSKSTVQRILRSHGRKLTKEEQLRLARAGGSLSCTTTRDGEATRAMIRKLYEEGYKPVQIAEMVGRKVGYVYEIHSKQQRGIIS